MGALRPDSGLDAAIAALSATQEGLLRRSDLERLGLGAKAIAHRVRTHRLFVHHPGVYSLAPGPHRRETAWLAAVWWCDGVRREPDPSRPVDTVLSHVSAGAFHGLGPEPEPAVVHVTTTRDVRSRRGVVVHVSRCLDRTDWAQHGLLPVTNRSRTIVDEASMLPFGAFRGRVDRLKELPVDALHAALKRAPDRPGCAATRRLLHGDGRHTKSVLERKHVRFCRMEALPAPERNVWVAGHKADCLHRAHRLVIELDGRAFHERKAQSEADRDRDADDQLAGFRILRLTWWDLEPERAARTAARTRAFLATVPPNGP